MFDDEEVPFEDLKGQVILEINGLETGSDFVEFLTDKNRYKMYHYQDCCESVSVSDICGDISDIIGSEVLMAEETIGGEEATLEGYESMTWTFYKICTIKGDLIISWLGSSNGYYSESVYFSTMKKSEDF
jgi:hypothetical protein